MIPASFFTAPLITQPPIRRRNVWESGRARTAKPFHTLHARWRCHELTARSNPPFLLLLFFLPPPLLSFFPQVLWPCNHRNVLKVNNDSPCDQSTATFLLFIRFIYSSSKPFVFMDSISLIVHLYGTRWYLVLVHSPHSLELVFLSLFVHLIAYVRKR